MEFGGVATGNINAQLADIVRGRINKRGLMPIFKPTLATTGKNVIVTAHNSVIKCEMFINDNCPKKLDLEEGGFYILSKSKEGIKLKYEFHNFNRFTRVFYER